MYDRHQRPVIGVLGGSGLYEIEGLDETQWIEVHSPWGTPSDSLYSGSLNGVRIVFLPRHGRGHCYPPTDINYRANIDILKRAGVTDLISLSAVGSFREAFEPGTFVIVDQFIDRTFAREKSFFGKGLVAHVSMADPVCPRLGEALYSAASDQGLKVFRNKTYLCMEGPQFSTRAESELYRSWGCDIIGMTNMPEAKLAREAEICYASVAMVTDFDCWHPDHHDVQVADILKVLTQNANNARSLVKNVAPAIAAVRPGVCPHRCDRALDTAIITSPDARSAERLAKLDAVAGRVLGEV